MLYLLEKNATFFLLQEIREIYDNLSYGLTSMEFLKIKYNNLKECKLSLTVFMVYLLMAVTYVT